LWHAHDLAVWIHYTSLSVLHPDRLLILLLVLCHELAVLLHCHLCPWRDHALLDHPLVHHLAVLSGGHRVLSLKLVKLSILAGTFVNWLLLPGLVVRHAERVGRGLTLGRWELGLTLL